MKAFKGDCWIWEGRTNKGYGRLRINGQSFYVHRVYYEMQVGPVPAGMELDHLCRVKLCYNPAHLEPVSHRENILRGVSPAALHARATHCKRGHPFNHENTYHERTRIGVGRRCRRCNADAVSAYNERQRCR